MSEAGTAYAHGHAAETPPPAMPVLALQSNWRCTGVDGMCGPEGEPEVAVPGAICRQVDAAGDRCTYACEASLECPTAVALQT